MRFATLALACFCVAGSLSRAASKNAVTVVMDFEHPQSATMLQALHSGVRNMLNGNVDVRFSEPSKIHVVPGRLVVFHMHGYCAMDGPANEKSQSGVALGWTAVSDGVVLPFADVNCDRVRASLNNLFGSSPNQHEYQFGTAVARVVSHELYHMLAGLQEHTSTGTTKSALSPAELVAAPVALPRAASSAIEESMLAEGR